MDNQLSSRGLPHYQRILYATDGSASGLEAGRHAVFLAQRAQTQLIVLCVVPTSITRRLSVLLRRAAAEERRNARETVELIVKLAAGSGV